MKKEQNFDHIFSRDSFRKFKAFEVLDKESIDPIKRIKAKFLAEFLARLTDNANVYLRRLVINTKSNTGTYTDIYEEIFTSNRLIKYQSYRYLEDNIGNYLYFYDKDKKVCLLIKITQKGFDRFAKHFNLFEKQVFSQFNKEFHTLTNLD